MRKTVISILLVVALLLSVTYAGAEKSFEEMDKEYDQLLEEAKESNDIINRMDKVKEILANGNNAYPIPAGENMRMDKVQLKLPDGFETDVVAMRDMCGIPYLQIGTVQEMNGLIWYVDFSGVRVQILAMCYFDNKTKSVIDGASIPAVGEKGNFFVTFYTYDFTENIPVFLLGITETEYATATN